MPGLSQQESGMNLEILSYLGNEVVHGAHTGLSSPPQLKPDQGVQYPGGGAYRLSFTWVLDMDSLSLVLNSQEST